MKKTIKLLTIAILISIGIFAVNAQESTIAVTNEVPTAKAEKKETVKNQQTSSDYDSWSGFYVGGYGGYTSGRANPVTSTQYDAKGYFALSSIARVNNAGNQRLRSNGFNGGGAVGYNYQKNKLVIGGEVDFGANGSNKTVTSSGLYPCCSPTGFTMNQTVKSNWMMTARPRVGVAFKKALLYATGGIAVTNIKYVAKFTDTYASAIENGNFSKTRAGWTAGAGMEFKVASSWSVKGEYLFSQFGRSSITSTDFKAGLDSNGENNDVYTINPFTHSTDLRSHSIRFGINYRF